MIVESYKELLEKNGYLPLNQWRHGKVEHQVEKIKNQRNPQQRLKILEQGRNTPGVYIYFHKEKCLNAGTAFDIGERFCKSL